MTLPPPGGERDLTDPFKNPPRDRTPQREWAHSSEPPWKANRRRARVGLLVTVVVGAGLAMVAYVGVTIARGLHTVYAAPVDVPETHPAAPAPVVTPATHNTSAMVIPVGWITYTSPGNGPFAYAYDPAWTDLRNSPEDQQFQKDALAARADTQDSVFLAGDWQKSATANLPAAVVRVIKDPLAGRDLDLKTNVEQYAGARAAYEGDDSPQVLSSANYAHPLGYAGWTVGTRLDVNGETIFMDVTGIEYGDSVVFVSVTSHGSPVYIDAVAASVVFLPQP